MNERTQTNELDPLINLLFDDGLQNALPRIAEILMNAAMMLEREAHIGAAPYQRGVERNGYANGFKPRTFQTGIGSLKLSVPQVRESDRVFSTSLLEKGSRSDRALKVSGVCSALRRLLLQPLHRLHSLQIYDTYEVRPSYAPACRCGL
jgi:transposase-like protein